jgi:hypothetical protein
MKGKLIKTDLNYILEDDKGVVIASTSLKKEGLSLSPKNCREIERGYDLDELVKREYLDGYDTTELCRNAFKDGFQKALELMDKNFNEDDLRLAMHFGKFGEANSQTTTIGFIQSLQQTEWDVEVVMVPAMSNNGNVYYGDIPKLDADGCLILKRI